MGPLISAHQQDLYNASTIPHSCEVADKVESFNVTFEYSEVLAALCGCYS